MPIVPNLLIRLQSPSSPICTSSVKLFGVQVLLQIDAEFFSKWFEIAQVFVVLALVFDFCLDTYVSEVSVLGNSTLKWARHLQRPVRL